MRHSGRRARLAVFALLAIMLGGITAGLRSDRFKTTLHSALTRKLHAALGERASIGRVEARPFRFSVAAFDVRAPLGDGSSALEAGTVLARVNPLALLTGRVRLSALSIHDASIELNLDDPVFRVRRSAGAAATMPALGVIDLKRVALRLRAGILDMSLGEVSGTLSLPGTTAEGTASGELVFAIQGLRIDGRNLAPGNATIKANRSDEHTLALSKLSGQLRTGPFAMSGVIGTNPLNLALDFEARIDSETLVRTLGGNNELTGGGVLKGRIEGPGSKPRFHGRLAAKRLVAVGRVPLENVSATVLAGRDSIRLVDAGLQMLGAQVAFTAGIVFQNQSPVEFQYRATGIDFSRVRSAIPGFPLRTGTADAVGQLILGRSGKPTRFDGHADVRTVEAAIRKEFTDPRLQYMLNPFSGTTHYHFESNVLTLDDTALTNDWTQATGEGRFDLAGPVACRFALRAARLAPITPTAGPEYAWLDAPSRYRLDGLLDGDLNWTGTATDPILEFSGTTDGVLIEGPSLDDGNTGASAAMHTTSVTVRMAERVVDWSVYSAGPGGLTASGRADVSADGPLRQHIDFQTNSWDASTLARLVGSPVPWSGSASASGSVSSDGEFWSGPIHVSGAAGPVGRRFEETIVDLELAPQTVHFHRLALAAQGGRLEAAGTMAGSANQLNLRITSTDLPLAALDEDLGSAVDGVVAGEVLVSGRWPAVSATGRFDLRAVHLWDTPIGDLEGTVGGGRNALVLHAQREPDFAARLELTLRAPWAWMLDGHFDEMALGPILKLAASESRITPQGSASGTLQAHGNLGDAQPLHTALVTVAHTNLHAEVVELRSDNPFRISWSPPGRITLDELELLGSDTHLHVSGAMDSETRDADFRLRGSTDLRLARALLGDVALSGRLEIDAHLLRSAGKLALNGEARLARGYFRSPNLPFPLRDIEASATLSGSQARLGALDARFGAGRIHAAGDFEFDDPAGVKARLEVDGDELQLTLFRNLELRADAKVLYELGTNSRQLSGTLQVTRAIYRAPSEGLGTAAVTPTFTGDALALEGFPETGLNLKSLSQGDLWYVSDEARLQGDAVLQLGGTTADPSLLGSVRYLSQERLKVDGRQYRVRRGNLVFDNPREIDPRIDFEAETSLKGYRIVLGLSGRLLNPMVTARSDPPLAQADALALLIGGRPEEGFGVIGPTGGQEIFRSLFLPRAFGALTHGRVLIDPTALAGRADPTEVLPLSFPVGERLDVVAGLPLRQATPGLFILNWRPLQGFALSAIRDLDQGWGAEITHERRFGAPRTNTAEAIIVRELLVDAPGLPATELARRLTLKPGARTTRQAIRQDAERLSAELSRRGWPLARVTTAIASDPGSTAVIITFTIEAGTRIELETPGAKFSDAGRDRLLETVKTFGLYEQTASELERVARSAHEEKGFAKSIVSCESTPIVHASPAVRINCEVDPGQRYKVNNIRLEGNQQIDTTRLREYLRTRSALLRPARFITADVEDDVRMLELLHRDEGFLNVTVRAELREGVTQGNLDLIYHISEGPRWTLGDVLLSGDGVIPDESLNQDLDLQPGLPFRSSDIRAARDRLFARHDALGYMEASVRTESRREEETRAVAVTFIIAAGSPARVRNIRVEGTRRTHPNVVRRELRFSEGGLLSYDRIARSQRRLFDLGVFRSVEIRTEPGDEASRDVVVQVEEAAPYRLEVGGGYDSEDGVRALAEISDTNFSGRAQFLALQARLSSRLSRGQLLYRDPRAFGLPFSGLLTAVYQDREEVSFREKRLSLRSEAARLFGRTKRSRATLRYTLADTRLSDLQVSTIAAGAEDVRLGSIGAGVTLDHRDDVLEPHHGWLGSADVEFASRFLLSEADYIKLSVNAFGYHALSRKAVLGMGLRAGLGFTRRFQDQIPLAERYFAGGATTLRGLGFNLAGPLDPSTGKPTGGDAVVIFNGELRYALLRSIVGTAFVDAGEVFRGVDAIELGQLRWSLGVGLRYRGPVLAGVDYARLLGHRPEEADEQLHFTLGYAF